MLINSGIYVVKCSQYKLYKETPILAVNRGQLFQIDKIKVSGGIILRLFE